MNQHPLSAAFPGMMEADFAALVADVQEFGQREPGVVLDGMVLDGWHRYRAAETLCIQFQCIEFTGDDPVSFVKSRNLHRRHLDESQRAAAVIACGQWASAGNPNLAHGARLPTNAELAREAQVSERTISNAKAAHKAGLSGAVIAGDMSVRAAAQIAKDRQPSAARDIPFEDESAEEIAARTDATAMKPPAGLVTEQEDDEFLAEMNSLRDMNTDLHREIDSLTATDTGLEIHRLMQLLLHTENALKECREHAAVREKALKWFGKQYVELRTLLDVKEDRGVVAAVKILKASAK